MEKKTRGALTPYETAAIASAVPASADPAIDGIITQSLRFKAALAILEAIIASDGPELHFDRKLNQIVSAVAYADALIEEFRK